MHLNASRWAGLAITTAGCLDAHFEAPYILATGLGDATSLCPSGRGTLLVGSRDGVFEVAPDGSNTRLSDLPVRRLTAHPDRVAALSGDTLRWGALPAAGQQIVWTTSVPVAAAVDVAGWYGGAWLVATADGVLRLTPTAPGETISAPFADLAGVRAIALAGPGHPNAALAITADTAWLLNDGNARPLATGLQDARAIADDAQGHTWVVHGERPVLAKLSASGPVTLARYLGTPSDLQFGTGGPLPADHAYLASGEGTVDFVVVPPTAPAIP